MVSPTFGSFLFCFVFLCWKKYSESRRASLSLWLTNAMARPATMVLIGLQNASGNLEKTSLLFVIFFKEITWLTGCSGVGWGRVRRREGKPENRVRGILGAQSLLVNLKCRCRDVKTRSGEGSLTETCLFKTDSHLRSKPKPGTASWEEKPLTTQHCSMFKMAYVCGICPQVLRGYFVTLEKHFFTRQALELTLAKDCKLQQKTCSRVIAWSFLQEIGQKFYSSLKTKQKKNLPWIQLF